MTQTRLALLLVSLSLALSVAAAAWAGPRDEKKRLTKADMALARRAIIRPSDLVRGWKRVRVPEEGHTRCTGYDPDFSRFTLTGQGRSGFLRSGAAIASEVSVYAGAGQGAAAFEARVKPRLLDCLGGKVVRRFAKAGIRASIASRRMSATPRIGARNATFRLVLRLTENGRTVPYYLDLFTFQVDREIGALSFQALGKRIPNETALARLVASRL